MIRIALKLITLIFLMSCREASQETLQLKEEPARYDPFKDKDVSLRAMQHSFLNSFTQLDTFFITEGAVVAKKNGKLELWVYSNLFLTQNGFFVESVDYPVGTIFRYKLVDSNWRSNTKDVYDTFDELAGWEGKEKIDPQLLTACRAKERWVWYKCGNESSRFEYHFGLLRVEKSTAPYKQSAYIRLLQRLDSISKKYYKSHIEVADVDSAGNLFEDKSGHYYKLTF